ncbi:cilia- and flagella-associated protein 58 [Eupeodes corollae]|uniref:cilia- and flagella-associated protein 58 n=1 Tax=Eupeodes corollae TaxID=290404 RepID=UPI0024900815|nr:cilia- and flagella-associated protein 58 [Eupeodes corollae]
MPPKPKVKGKGKSKPVAPIVEEEKIIEAPSQDSIPDKDVDLVNDLNDEFFNSANKTIQNLVQTKNLRDAGRVRKFISILHNIHKKYLEELKINEELKPQVERANVKLRLAIELVGNSQEAMDRMKEVLGDSWRETDASLSREQDVQEKLYLLMAKLAEFEEKENEKKDDNAEFGNLAKYKNIILRERDRINAELLDHEKRLQLQRYYSESLEYINKVAEENFNRLNNKTRVIESEKNNLDIKVKNLTNALEDQKEYNASTVSKLEQTNRELSESHQKVLKKSMEIDKQKLMIEKFRSENLVYARQQIKHEAEMEANNKEKSDLEETIRVLRAGEKQKTEEVNQLTKRYKKTVYDYDALSQKLYKMDRKLNTLNEESVKQKNLSNALEKDLLSSAQKMEDLRRLKDYVTRERDGLRSDIAKLNNNLSDQRHTNMMQSNKIDNLNLDIQKLNVKLDEAKINISKAEKERDGMAQEVESQRERIENLQDQIQLKTDQVSDLTEKLAAKHAAFVNLKKNLEAAHSEKMVLQRSLETCTQERDNFRVLQNKSMHQMAQLTAEINANQNKINVLSLNIEKLNNDKKELQTELRSTRVILASVRNDLKELRAKNDRLLKTIAEDEIRFLGLSHELDDTRKNKNLIGLQMVRRNDEIVLLKEKVLIIQTALDQGQVQYNQRLEDIRLLKVEITNLHTERDCLSKAVKSTADMRIEIIRLQRLLTEERVRCRALMEDARMPGAVHRWRILKGTQPGKYELIQKVQMLQRRNLRQEVQKVRLEQKLQENEKICESMKKIVEKLPTADVKDQLNKSQWALREKEKKLKAMIAELSVNQIELRARDCAIDEFKATLKLTTQSMLEEKRKSARAARQEVKNSSFKELSK